MIRVCCFFLVRFLECGSFCIRYKKKDISLRRFPQEFLSCSVKRGWVNLGSPNHVQVLLEAFWGSAALSGSSPVVHMAQVVIWRDGKHALTPGEKWGWKKFSPSVQNPQGVFSWCGYNLMIFFQNILFCTNLLKQLYIHFWRTVLKKKSRERRHNGLGWISFQCT